MKETSRKCRVEFFCETLRFREKSDFENFSSTSEFGRIGQKRNKETILRVKTREK